MRTALLLALVAALAGCGGASESAPAEETAAPTSTAGAPRVAGTTLDGKRISLDDFRGRPVLVNVWSSW